MRINTSEAFASGILGLLGEARTFREQLYEAERATTFSSGVAKMEKYFQGYNQSLTTRKWDPETRKSIKGLPIGEADARTDLLGIGQIDDTDLDKDHQALVEIHRNEINETVTNDKARDQLLQVLEQKAVANYGQVHRDWEVHRVYDLVAQTNQVLKGYMDSNMPPEEKKKRISATLRAAVQSGVLKAVDAGATEVDLLGKVDMAFFTQGAIDEATRLGKDYTIAAEAEWFSKNSGAFSNRPDIIGAVKGIARKHANDALVEKKRLDDEFDEKAMNVLVTAELKAYAPGVSLVGRKRILVGLLETGVPEAKYRNPEQTRRDIDRYKSDIAEIDRQLAGGPDTVDKAMVDALEDQLRYASTHLKRGLPTDVDLDLLGIPANTIVTPTMLQNKSAPFARFLGDWFRSWYDKIGSDRTDAGGMAYDQIEKEIERRIAALDKKNEKGKSPSYLQDRADISSQGFSSLNRFSEFLINVSDPDKIEKELNNILVSMAIPEVTRRTDVIPDDNWVARTLDAFRTNSFELFYFNAVQGKYGSMVSQLNAKENKPKWDAILASTNLKIMGVTGGGTLKPITKVGESNPVVDDLGIPVFVFITNEPVTRVLGGSTVTTIEKREVNLRLQPKRASNGIDWNSNELVVAEFRQSTAGVWDWFPLDDQRTVSQRADYFSAKLNEIAAKGAYIERLKKEMAASSESLGQGGIALNKANAGRIDNEEKALVALRNSYDIEKAKSERFIR